MSVQLPTSTYPDRYNSSSSISIEDFSSIPSSPIIPVLDHDSPSFPAACIIDDDLSVTMLPMEHNYFSPNDRDANSTLEHHDPLIMKELVEDVTEWLMGESYLPPLLNSPEDDSRSLRIMSPMSPQASIDRVFSNQSPLSLSRIEMKVDNQLSILHLLKAYGEAVEMEMKELAKEILIRLKDKACPVGSTLERLAYYLILALEGEMDFLCQEASKNYEVAFKAFYQIFPYGRFAHFAANSVILEALPEEADTVHIVDFDIGQGMQWPPMIEALARRGKRAMRLTAIKWEDASDVVTSTRKFDEIKMQLYEHARMFGLRLKMEEMDMEDLVSEMKIKRRGGTSDDRWLAFNCMVGLPHMGRLRSARSFVEFLSVAKDSTSTCSLNCGGGGRSRGTVTIGDGIGWGKGVEEQTGGYGSIFEMQLVQLHALMESMECGLPFHLREARLAMECLFLIPHISGLVGLQMWKDITRESKALSEIGLEAWRITKDNLMEGKELVRETESLYSVRINGGKDNQMELSYTGIPLVKVSSWK